MNTKNEKKNEYVNLLRQLTGSVKQSLHGAPPGSLKVNRVRGKIQFCQRLPGGGCRYLNAEEYGLAVKLAQKDYDLKVLKLLKAKSKEAAGYVSKNAVRFNDPFTVRFFMGYLYQQMDEIYESMIPERQAMVKPLVPLTRDFVRDWLAEPYEGKGFRSDDTTAYYTGKDVRVRSKSELYIANKLDDEGAPSKYECPLYLGGRVIYPDFTVLNICSRTVKYLEHHGKIGDQDYDDSFVWKINFYQENEIYQGEDLITTFESARHPLNTRSIDRVIHHFFYVDSRYGPKI